MTYFAQLRASALREISTERIGTAVFTRIIAEVSADHGHLLESATQAVLLSEEFLAKPAESLFVTGDVEKGQLSVQVDLADGRTALVTVALMRDRPRLDVLVVGNRGTIQHSPSRDSLAGRVDAGPLNVDDETVKERGDELHQSRRQALQKALANRELVPIEKRGDR